MIKSNQKLHTLPNNIHGLMDASSNIYENTVVMTKRAKQIFMHRKEILDHKLEDFTHSLGEADLVDRSQQAAITQQDERSPKPIIVAIKEFLNQELDFHY